MKFKFSIANKLLLGFGVLALAVALTSVRTFTIFKNNMSINEQINTIHNPTVYHLNDLYLLISNSEMLIKNWVFIDEKVNTVNKRKLIDLHKVQFPQIRDTLTTLSNNWPPADKTKFREISVMITDTLFKYHKEIMDTLATFEAYTDAQVLFEVEPKVSENSTIVQYTEKILSELLILLEAHRGHAADGSTAMRESFEKFQRNIIFMGATSLIVALIVALLTINSLVLPIKRLKTVIADIGKGILPKRKIAVRNDEIGEMAQALNSMALGLRKTIDFSLEIGKGNFNTDFRPLSDQDDLGNSLVQMRENLIAAAEKEQQQKQKEEERHWLSRGMAQFGEILRTYNTDLYKLSYKIINELVLYIGANQAGIFVLNDDGKQPYLEQTGAFAYERHKYASKKLDIGEGLVGACFVEKEAIFLTDVPKGYINITSGLGKATPRCLVLMPLKMNNEVFGVMELASFDIFTQVQREFIEKIAESIASTISYMKVNIRTAKLLTDSQQKSEMLAQQEEEMRQSMEEIQATQEESENKMKQFSAELEAINNAVYKIECSIEGQIVRVNDNLLKLLDVRVDEIIGRSISDISIEHDKDDLQVLIGNLLEGKSDNFSLQWTTHSLKQYKLMFTFMPLFDNSQGFIERIVAITNTYQEISQDFIRKPAY